MNRDIDNFKQWFFNQDKPVKKKHVGEYVESKVSTIKKLINKIDCQEGEPEVVAKDFLENGGVIKDYIDKHFLIEVNSGSFYIPSSSVEKS